MEGEVIIFSKCFDEAMKFVLVLYHSLVNLFTLIKFQFYVKEPLETTIESITVQHA